MRQVRNLTKGPDVDVKCSAVFLQSMGNAAMCRACGSDKGLRTIGSDPYLDRYYNSVADTMVRQPVLDMIPRFSRDLLR